MKGPRRSVSERIYGALLRLYPSEFRRQFGDDMRDLFRDHLRAARERSGTRGVIGLWVRAIPDLCFTGIHEHEGEMLEAIVQDARYAVRILRKNPVFAIVAIAVVALGTGAVSTIFSVANAVILRPIPGVAHQSEVISILRTRGDHASSRSASYPFYERLASNSRTMSGIAAWDMLPITISTGAEGVRAQSDLVTANYFDVLGVRPALGRFFIASEGRPGEPVPVVVISHELWERQFSADSSVLGRQILLNGKPFTVIGVAPPRFNGLYPVLRTDAWVPMPVQPLLRRGADLLTSAGSGWLEVFGRTAPGGTREAAHAELAALAARYAQDVEAAIDADMATFVDVQLTTVTGLPVDASKPVLTFFIVLLVVSGLVLLIASVNVASMLLARAVARRREIAVRVALGAGRLRLVRQLLTESIVLFAIGGGFGALLSVYCTRLLSRIPLPVDVPLALDPSPDARVLVVTLAVALVTGVVFGLAPAVQGSRGDVATSLRGDSAGSGRARSRLRSGLVAAQVAASLLLLTTSGLFVRALLAGQQVRPGYDIDHLATAALDVTLSGYDTVRSRAFYDGLRERVAAMPGVTGVAYARLLPLSMNSTGFDFSIPGRPQLRGFTNANYVDGGYLELLHQPIIAGRGLRASDNASALKVAVVSQLFANRYWPGENPIGKTFMLDSSTTVTVVGLTPNVKFARLDEKPAPFVYMPIAQHWRSDMNLLVRTTGDASRLIDPIRAAVRAIDPLLPPPVTVTMERASAVALLPQRFAAIITASLGAAGLLLAAIGLYGVLSFSTAQRAREIGVRMALGAARRDVLRMIVREGMRMVWVGVAVGLVLAMLASRALAPFLFGINPMDATTFIVMTLILAATAFAASVIPARRAASADPLAALRQE